MLRRIIRGVISSLSLFRIVLHRFNSLSLYLELCSLTETRCEVIVAPMVDTVPRPAGITQYERWCQSIVPPTITAVTAYAPGEV